jgi:hypothetical protein
MPKKLVGLAFVPIGPGEHRGDGGHLGLGPREARANHHPDRGSRMEIVVDHFHLAGWQPIDPGDGIDGEAVCVEEFGGGDDLARMHGGVEVITLGTGIDRPATGGPKHSAAGSRVSATPAGVGGAGRCASRSRKKPRCNSSTETLMESAHEATGGGR